MNKHGWSFGEEAFVFVLSFFATTFGITFAILLAACLSPLALVSAAVAGAGILGMKATVP